jgi:putative ABC transport system permease protein
LLYIALIAVYSLIALAIALPVTGRFAYALGGFLSREINYIQQGYRVIPISVFLQVTVALLVPQFAGIFPILRGSQVTVQEALNGLPQSGGNASSDWIDSLATRSRNLPRPMLISLRNTFRKKIRLILTLFTLTLGGAIFIATFVVQSSLVQYIDRISKYFTADVSITFDRPYRMTDVENVARELPEVTAVEGWVSTVAEISMEKGKKGESVSILAPPADSQLIQPMLIKGRWIIPGDQNAIAVNERFISLFPNLKVGDTLKLKIDNDDTEWVIVGIFQFAGKSGGYLAYANYDYLSKMIHTSFRSQVYRVAANLQGHDQQSQENFGQRLEDHFKSRGYNVIDISTGRWMQSAASEGLNVLLAFLLMMASLIAIVGSIGLTGTMSMNVMERTREIGVMRAIGASDRAIMSQVIVEGLIIGGLSWIFGSLLAFPISRAMADGVSYALFGAPAIFNYTPTGFLVWLGVATVLSIFASVLPARNAARLTIREVLAYE